MRKYHFFTAALCFSVLIRSESKAGIHENILYYTPIDKPAAIQISAGKDTHPGARYGASTWTDKEGNYWIFGGNGYDASGNLGLLNDLWKLDSKSGEWQFVKGGKLRNQKGKYGMAGIADINSMPGCRSYSTAWTDKDGNLILFGGYGVDASGNTGPLGDLWEFNLIKDCWIWIQGSDQRNQSGLYGN